MRQDYRNLAAYHLCCENSFAPFLLRLREPWSKSLKLGVFLSPSVDAVDAKFCICNPQSISQAGRRGFESVSCVVQSVAGRAIRCVGRRALVYPATTKLLSGVKRLMSVSGNRSVLNRSRRASDWRTLPASMVADPS